MHISEFDELVQLEQQAEAAGKGVWTKNPTALKAVCASREAHISPVGSAFPHRVSIMQAVREPIWNVDDLKSLVDPKKLHSGMCSPVQKLCAYYPS